MSVNPKEKRALQEMWNDAKAPERAPQTDLPDGVYEFAIVACRPNIDKHRLEVTYKVVGGNESYLDVEHTQFENLGDKNGIGYFKDKLKRLKLHEELDLDELDVDLVYGTGKGTLAALLPGLRFAGQTRNKDAFLNIYVNRLLGRDEGGQEQEKPELEAEAPEQEQEQAEAAPQGEWAEGDAVTFTSKSDGELEAVVKELLDEDGAQKARVFAESTGKVYKVPVERLIKVAAEEEGEEEGEAAPEEEQESEDGEAEAPKGNGGFPKPAKVESMRAPELKQLLQRHGVRLETLRQPREFAQGVAGFVHDPKYVPSISMLAALAAGLGVKYQKGAKPALVVKQLRESALRKFAKS